MSICRSCGSNVTNNFCSFCGTPVAPSPTRNCPRCNSIAAPDAAFCSRCGIQLPLQQYGAQTPQYAQPAQPVYPNQPASQQNNVGKYLMGALGGAAAVLGGEILLNDVERGIERRVDHDEWSGREHHHRHHQHHHRRCACGHEFGLDIDICPRCRRRWGHW
jgi:Double zinc ribbon